jgi:hypothetical protein
MEERFLTANKIIRLSGNRVRTFDSAVESANHTADMTQWPDSASELYRPSDRRLSAKLVSTFEDRGMSRSQPGSSSTAVSSPF